MSHTTAYVPKNNREWFLNLLFNDSDFLVEKQKILNELKLLASNRQLGIMFLLAGGGYSLLDQLKAEYKTNTQKGLAALKITEQVEAFADGFNVSIDSIEQGLRYSEALSTLTFHRLPSVVLEDNKVVVRLDGTMRLEDIQAIYPQIMKLQNKLPGYTARNRSKVHPELIYAIYKQRLQNKSFKMIYRLYDDGLLPGYRGTVNIVGEENFARMYRRFKPDI